MKRKSLRILTAAFLLNLICAPQYSWSVLSKELIRTYGWTTTQASLPYTVFTTVAGTSVIGFGLLSEKVKPRVLGMMAGILLFIGFFGGSVLLAPATLAVVFGVFGGLGSGMTYPATTPTAVRWWPAKVRGRVSGISSMGSGLTSLYVAPLAQLLIAGIGLKKTMMGLGFYALAGAFVMSRFLKTPDAGELAILDEENRRAEAETHKNLAHVKSLTTGQMLRTSVFYKLLLLMSIGVIGGQLIVSQMSMIASVQAGWEAGFVTVMILAAFNGLGRIVFATLSDKIGLYRTFMVMNLLGACNLLGFTRYHTIPEIILGAAIAGMCFGGNIPLTAVAAAEEFGSEHLSANASVLNVSFAIAGFVGPMFAAAVYDARGSYAMAYLIVAALLVGCAVLSLTLDRRSRKLAREFETARLAGETEKMARRGSGMCGV